MRINMKQLITILLLISIAGCADNSNWICTTYADAMFSRDHNSGAMGSADKGCSCTQMYNFEYKQFGGVDVDALNADFGCNLLKLN